MFAKINQYRKENGLWNTIIWLYNCFVYEMRKKKYIQDYEKLKETSIDKKYSVNKSLNNVFMVAGIPYYDIGGGQRCSQLAKTFNKMGFNVFYLYAFKSSESTTFSLEIPFASHIFIDDKIISKIEQKVNEGDLFIFEAPSDKFSSILDLALSKKCKIIYENIDNWETSLGSAVYNEEMLKKFLKHSDLVVGTARPLVDQINNYYKKYDIPLKPIKYLANAVDEELFCGLKDIECPKDLVIGKKTLLYYGSLWGEWFDWDLLIGLANKNHDYEINLIGDDSSLAAIKEKCPDNMHFLGLKRQIDLPAYLKYTDYTLIPFKPGKIGDYVSPLKVFEYICMYTNVLSTRLPDIEGYPNVYFGNTTEEWDKIIKEENEVDIGAANEFISNNTWFNRVTEMIDSVFPEYEKSSFYNKISIVILNYNNKNVIFKSLDSLLRFNDKYNYEVIIVDNGSTDGSYEILEKNYKNKIKLIKNTKNGCSSGRNLGAKNSSNEYLLFLDSDQWATNKYWLLVYEKILEQVENVGAIGWAAGFFNSKGEAYYTVDAFDYRHILPIKMCQSNIGYLGSGGMIIKKELFDSFGGFDEKYDPTCFEDTDISLSIRNAGKELYYSNNLGIIHLPHQTTLADGTDSHKKMYDERQEYFMNKWKEKNKKLLKLYIKKK